MRPPLCGEDIPDAIVQTLGGIRSMAFPRQGHTSDVAIVHAAEGTFVLKRASGPLYGGWLARERDVLRLLSRTALRVPAVYGFWEEEGGTGDKAAWLLMERLPGQSLRTALQHERDSAVRSRVLYRFGRLLREIHATPCPAELKSEGGGWLDAMLAQAEYNLANYDVDGTPELLQRLKNDKPEPVGQTLIHGDFTIDNVLVHEERIAGIIDWSGGACGDPRYDVALAVRPKPNLFQTSEDRQSFFEGYGEASLTEDEFVYFESGLYAFF
ncbi:phosphotransferase family protein [Paenibacillus flagellatus]|nr:phosphotransferase [Paenibacillus flagellatus]